jgi:site-specific recombinase XerD
VNSLIPSSPTFDFSAIERADLQPSTRIKYQRAIDAMLLAGVDPFDYPSLQSYTDSLSTSARGFLKAALKVVTDEELTRIKAGATPGNIAAIQALTARLEAMDETIKTHTPKGTKTHTWLSAEQVEEITSLPDRSTPRGMRDYIVLAILLGAGLRREELENLTFTSLLQQPARSGLRDVLSVTGKGNKRRTIPISAVLARHIREWHKLAGDGYIARAINKAGTINGSLSSIGIHNIVRSYGAQIGIAELDSHDLRRTYARLGYNAGVPVEQISLLLGHAGVKTTMLYLGIDIDIEKTVSDFIPLSGD